MCCVEAMQYLNDQERHNSGNLLLEEIVFLFPQIGKVGWQKRLAKIIFLVFLPVYLYKIHLTQRMETMCEVAVLSIGLKVCQSCKKVKQYISQQQVT